MSIITVPDGLVAPAGCTIGQARYDLTESSDSTGSEAARLLAPPRWSMSLRSIEAMTPVEAGLWEAMLLQLRGRINHLAVHDFGRPEPAGTLRGTLTLQASAAAGDTSIVLAGARTARNLLLNTRAFDQSPWSAINAGTATADTAVDPLGETAADTLTDANGSQSAGRRQTITVPADSAHYVGSLFVKKTTGGTSPTLLFQLSLQGGSIVTRQVRINTDLGTVLAGTAHVVDYSADWWRIDATLDNDGTNTSLRFDVFPAVNTYGGTTTDVTATGSATVWGAQLELGTSPTAYAPPTLLPGDWLQIGTGVGTSQLVKVVATATEAAQDGTLSVTFEPPLRWAFSSAAVVAWDKPLGYYKQTSAPSWSYRIGRSRKEGGFAVDLLESWA